MGEQVQEMSYLEIPSPFIGFGIKIDMIMMLMKLGLHNGEHEEVLNL
jgi:hypothetical protein